MNLPALQFKLYFICTIHKYLQSNTVIIEISITQTGFRRKFEDSFESVFLKCSIIQFTLRCCDRLRIYVIYKNILDLSVIIGYNIETVFAYRSTGMELRFCIHSGSTRQGAQESRYCHNFSLVLEHLLKP